MSQDLPLPSNIEIDVTLSQIFDSVAPTVDLTTYGYLYKLASNDGLFWKTLGAGAVDLTSPSSISSFGTATSLYGDTITVTTQSNTKCGTGALSTMGSATLAGGNTAFGRSALSLLPNDADQGIVNAFGYQAGMNLVGGFGSTFIGFQAGALLESSNNDILIGYRSLGRSTDSTGNNIAIGNETLYSESFDGEDNVCIGNQSQYALTTGEQNLTIGAQAGYTMTTGSYNVLLGHSAGFNILDGSYNIGIGINALNGIVDATENVCIGSEAMPSANGTGNTVIGNAAGFGLTSGTYNTILGNYGGFNLITGDFNCIIGSSATTNTGHSNCIVIGPNATSTASAQIRIGFNANADSVQTTCFLDAVRGKTTGQNDAVAVLVDSKGQLGTISSSIRYKENVQDVSENVIDSLFKMEPKTFNYIGNPDSKTFGMIAEDIDKILPDIVVYKEINGEMVPETIQYHLLVPLLVGAVKKLNLRCDDLQRQLNMAAI